MRWPAFLTRRPAPLSDQQRREIAARQEEALARRRAGRAERRERARKGAATKVHQQIARDPLFTERVAF